MERLARYDILEELGRGGMAVVYRGHDPAIDRPVAIKVLSEQFARDEEVQERFLREARTAARLEHRNILPVYDVGEEDGRQFLVMQLVEGGDLAAALERRGRLSLDQALPLLRPLADAIDLAHARGVVHRDIKPENVLLAGEGSPRLTDFGIARAMDDEGRGRTRTGQMIGTPEYLSPEQASGETVDQRSDLYSFGVLAYRMLTGTVPFHADSPVSTAIKHLHEPVPDPRSRAPELSDAAAAALVRMMAKRPEQRFSKAAEFVAVLAGEQSTPTLPEVPEPAESAPRPDKARTVVRSPPPPTPVPASQQSSLVVAILAAAVITGGSLILAAAMIGQGEPPDEVEPVEPPPAEPPPAPEPELVQLSLTGARASSVLHNDYLNYAPEELIDGDLNEAWNADNKAQGRDGRGEWFKLELGQPAVIRQVRVFPGHGRGGHYDSELDRTLNLFQANNRLRDVGLKLDDGYTQTLHFEDEEAWQEIEVPGTHLSPVVSFVVQGVYHGEPYGDLAVAEAEVYGYYVP